jgi:hypothetical protein
MQFDQMRRREFITLVGGVAAAPHALPLAALAPDILADTKGSAVSRNCGAELY